MASTRFADMSIDPRTKSALAQVFKYERPSKPQSEYLPVALRGDDVFVKARTGSGKTLGFLIPVLQRIVGISNTSRTHVRALIISPSRELAEQTATEARKLVTFFAGAIGVQIMIGGTSVKEQQRKLQTSRCDILVATPGRLQDHLDNTPGFKDRLAGVGSLVLDEADRLLDMGFAPAIRKIVAFLPPPDRRQTLLFTATVPEGVTKVADAFMRPGKVFIDTARGSNAGPSEALSRIDQQSVVVRPGDVVSTLFSLVAVKRRVPNHKIIVFVTTAMMAALMREFFVAAGTHKDAMELHSKLTQSQRNAVTKAFSEGTGVLLFASDVIARGIDFPDVTCVIQVGLTDTEQYEHRVGRTGRAGKSGEAVIILGDDEAPALLPALINQRKMNIKPVVIPSETSTSSLAQAVALVGTPGNPLHKNAQRTFVASLGFYNSHLRRLKWTPGQMVRAVWARFAAMGLREPPAIPVKTLGKMNLSKAADLPPKKVLTRGASKIDRIRFVM